MTPSWLDLVCFWMLQIPMAWMLARRTGLGPEGVFWAVAVAESILTLAAGFTFRRGRWKTRVV